MSTWGQAEIGDDEYEAAVTELTKPPAVPSGEAVGSHPGTALEWSARRHETPVPSGGQVDGEGEALGRVVREAWVEWAREQPDPKPAWLVGWDDLDDGQREVDVRIARAVLAARPVPSREALREPIAAALADAANDGCFDAATKSGDPEMWETNSEDRDYWRRLADAVLDVLHPQDGGRA